MRTLGRLNGDAVRWNDLAIDNALPSSRTELLRQPLSNRLADIQAPHRQYRVVVRPGNALSATAPHVRHAYYLPRVRHRIWLLYRLFRSQGGELLLRLLSLAGRPTVRRPHHHISMADRCYL